MSSKAFFKNSSIAPRLFRRFSPTPHTFLEIWTTTCIVTNFGQDTAAKTSILVNPSNPQLSGTSNFPYFPRGGPVPKAAPTNTMHKDWQPLGYVSQWGGMEVGNGMLFPVSVIDGLVHLYGGWKLKMECQWHRLQAAKEDPCPVGTAVVTSAGRNDNKLATSFTHVVHTTPPFYTTTTTTTDDPTSAAIVTSQQLGSCYHAVMKQAIGAFHEKKSSITGTLNKARQQQQQDELRLAFPLLGSGCRGFPHEIAMEIAVSASLQACRDWSYHTTTTNDDDPFPVALVFGLLEEKHAERMVNMVEQAMKEHCMEA